MVFGSYLVAAGSMLVTPGLEGALKRIRVGQQTTAALHEEELSVSLCWPFVDKSFTGVKIFHSNQGFASRVARQREAPSRMSQQRKGFETSRAGRISHSWKPNSTKKKFFLSAADADAAAHLEVCTCPACLPA